MTKKLSEEEMKTMTELRQLTMEVASYLGELNYQKMNIELAIEDQKEKVRAINKKEAEFFSHIRNTYGNVKLDVETGEIN